MPRARPKVLNPAKRRAGEKRYAEPTVMIDVIEWADEALYLAEESGRNRIQVARSTVLGPEAVPAGR